MKTEEEYFSLAQNKITERFDSGERVGLKDVCIEALKLQKADIESSQLELFFMQKIVEYVKLHYKEEWNKMGNTGEDGYWENATRDEIWHFGRFRALEDIQDFIESNFTA